MQNLQGMVLPTNCVYLPFASDHLPLGCRHFATLVHSTMEIKVLKNTFSLSTVFANLETNCEKYK